MTAVAESTLSPSVARRPSTVTRPAAINSSHARREPTPAVASTFCRRSPAALVAPSALGIGDLVHVVRQERRQRRQLLHAVEPQLLQEQDGGAVQERPAVGFAAALLDQAA